MKRPITRLHAVLLLREKHAAMALRQAEAKARHDSDAFDALTEVVPSGPQEAWLMDQAKTSAQGSFAVSGADQREQLALWKRVATERLQIAKVVAQLEEGQAKRRDRVEQRVIETWTQSRWRRR